MKKKNTFKKLYICHSLEAVLDKNSYTRTKNCSVFFFNLDEFFIMD